MADPLPSLALEMSMDGIALHQLAFDGHWHELSRVGLRDAALREKMANMKDIARRLEGKRFKVRVWLPADQIIRKSIDISGGDTKSRNQQARQILEKITPHSGADFAVSVTTPTDQEPAIVAAARIKTMQEASAFAKSHGFNAVVYSTRNPVEGFVDKPYLKLPPNRIRAVVLGGIGALLVASIVAAAVTFRVSDPYLWWETQPEVADFAPFQQPDFALDKSIDNILPNAVLAPEFANINAVETRSLREPLPYVPARQLDATALDTITQPPAIDAAEFDIAFSLMVEDSRFSLPIQFTNLPIADAADRPPAFGLYNVLTTITAIQAQPELPVTHQVSLPLDLVAPTPVSAPITVANIQFILEPLPSIAVTIPYSLQLELANTFGINLNSISAPEAEILAESQVVQVTRGLPDLLPKLRSGRPIPPQVAVSEIQPSVTVIELIPADLETIAAAARGFQIINGPPAIRPVRRVVPAVIDPPVVAEIAPEIDIAETSEPLVEFTGEIEIINAQPDLLPLLRSGNAIPEPGSQPIIVETAEILPPELPETDAGTALETVTVDPIEEIDPVLAASMALANSLRARRRPESIVTMEAPVDPMLSNAAPPNAQIPIHRGAGFDANAARIIEITSNRPRAVAPIVPADPQTVTLPTTASVARASTIENGINLRRTSLIGIFGTADNRDVMIRMASGRILQVTLGDSFSGWRVVAIGEDSVRIQKGNRTEILRMPN